MRQLWPKAEARLPSSAHPPRAKGAPNRAVVDVAVAPSKNPPPEPQDVPPPSGAVEAKGMWRCADTIPPLFPALLAKGSS